MIKGSLRSDTWLTPCTWVGSYFGPYLIMQRRPRWTKAIALGRTVLVEVTSKRKLTKKIKCGGDGIGVFKPFSFPVLLPSPEMGLQQWINYYSYCSSLMLAHCPISSCVYFIDISFLPSLFKLKFTFYFSQAILT